MKKILFLSLLIISTQVFAKNAVQKLLEEKSETPPYEVLKKFHNSPGTSIQVNELNMLNLDSLKTTMRFNGCALSMGETLEMTNLTAYSVSKMISGTPPKGPLFPGTPGQKIERFGLVVTDNVSIDAKRANEVLDKSRWDLTSNEKTTFIDQLEEEFVHSIEVKRHGDLISFVETTISLMDENSIYKFYGYCWND